MKIMRKILVALPLLFVLYSFYLKSSKTEEDVLTQSIFQSVLRFHFNDYQLNDSFSKDAFKEYINNLDAGKRFFLKSDFKELSQYQFDLDNQIKRADDEFFLKSVEIYSKRTQEAIVYIREVLDKPFNFEKTEYFEDSDDIEFAKNQKELKERWRTFMKYMVLLRLEPKLETMEIAIEQKDTSVEILPYDTLEARARKAVLKSQENYFERLNDLEMKDRQSLYINSLLSVLDPHTTYYPPADKENFDISISGKLEGIGAQLQEKDGYIKIVNIIAGGPASLQGELENNDLIIKVQQENEEPIDISGWRIDDAVKIIRGKKGTKVTLTVKKTDATIKSITIVRDEVVLEETYAKSTIIEDENSVKTGYIYLPKFYTDFKDNNGRTAWKDVRDEVIKLKKEGMQSLIIDLRNNGGGSLQDVVEMVGLFIDKGPVVQVKSRTGSARKMNDNTPGVEWDGNLIVMVNEFSASASEIFAAAIQDYNRGIVIGSKSHGKGSVQRFLDLARHGQTLGYDNFGSVKLTTQKFYRVNGLTTQLVGVSPDIVLPDKYSYIDAGERIYEHALKPDTIQKANFNVFELNYDLNAIIDKYNSIIDTSATFKLIDEGAKQLKLESENQKFPLNLAEYKSLQKQKKEENKKYNKVFSENKNLKLSLESELQKFNLEEADKKRKEEWIKRLKKDGYLHLALSISSDIVS